MRENDRWSVDAKLKSTFPALGVSIFTRELPVSGELFDLDLKGHGTGAGGRL